MQSIVILSGVPYDSSRQRPQHFASFFANKGYKVLYLSITDVSNKEVKCLLESNNSFVNAKSTSINSDGVYVLSKESSKGNINGGSFKENINDVNSYYYSDKPVFVVCFPGWLEFINGITYSKLIYDCMDDWESFLSDVNVNFTEDLISYERKIASVADLVIVSARRLYVKMAYLNHNLLYVPNGLVTQDYQESNNIDVPLDLKEISKPIVFFMGSISEWVDLELIKRIAVARPQYSLVFVGDERCKLPERNNVHYLGNKKYYELNNYLKQSRVAIIPFKINNLTAAVTPLKLYEYLGSGTPVVSTIMPDIIGLRGLKVASNYDQFIEYLDFYINMEIEDYQHEVSECKETSKLYDWSYLLNPIHEYIKYGRITNLESTKQFITNSINLYNGYRENNVIKNELLGFYNLLGFYDNSCKLFDFDEVSSKEINVDLNKLALAFWENSEIDKAVILLEKYIKSNDPLLRPYYQAIIKEKEFRRYFEVLSLKLSGDTYTAIKRVDSYLQIYKDDMKLLGLLAELYFNIGEFDFSFNITTELINRNSKYGLEEFLPFSTIEFLVRYLSELKEYDLAEEILLSLIHITTLKEKVIEILSNIYISKHMY